MLIFCYSASKINGHRLDQFVISNVRWGIFEMVVTFRLLFLLLLFFVLLIGMAEVRRISIQIKPDTNITDALIMNP